ncbi:hypothetical protein QEZ54_08600 [Catellatospora sp. KI3]|uniref:hypothetical protein n=1 Tax=Catellatospora sp. KI3 TaxID=3041620 RepID=UPI00248305D6|nr:hypothetical protein [Catellatospora sp. KI3]MDI1461021.1 hypothetical protein [Catellatospora sp. KI3]
MLDGLPAPAFAQDWSGAGHDNLRTVEQLRAHGRLLCSAGLGEDEGHAVVDKAFPHALHEVMVISAGKRVRSGLHDHSAAYDTVLARLFGTFVDHCADAELAPVISWSYDPATGDRASIQSRKRFHAHLVGRTPQERAVIAAQATTLRHCDPYRRRRIVEEVAVLAAPLIADCVEPSRLAVMRHVPPTSAHPAAARFRLHDGWATAADPRFYRDLRVVHELLRRMYDAIAAAWLTGVSGHWRRPGRRARR